MLPSVRAPWSQAQKSVFVRRRPRESRLCIHPVFLTTSSFARHVRLARVVPQSRFQGGSAYAGLLRGLFPGPEFQRRADRILLRSQRAFWVSLPVLLVVFLCLYPVFVERLIAAIPLSLFMLSLKEQGQSLYESTQSSTRLSGIGGLRASQPAKKWHRLQFVCAGGHRLKSMLLNKIAKN